MSKLPALPAPDETITVQLDDLPEFLQAYGLHIGAVTKDLVLVLVKKEEGEGHE